MSPRLPSRLCSTHHYLPVGPGRGGQESSQTPPTAISLAPVLAGIHSSRNSLSPSSSALSRLLWQL